MKVVAVIDQEDAVFKILKHLGLLAAPEESRAPPATASAPPPPPPQAAPHDLFSSTALLADAPFSEIPAGDLLDPPGPDPEAEDIA